MLPLERLVRVGQHIFVDALEFLTNRIVLVVRPIAGEDVVRPLAQQQVVLAHDDVLERTHVGIPERLHPAAQAEAAGQILFGPAGGLHDAVQ